MDLILDIKEKEISNAKAPSLPTPTPGTTGFPEHKKRSRPSAFKQKRHAAAGQNAPETNFQSSTSQSAASPTRESPGDERRKIDLENMARLESMSQDEIAEAQQELLNELDPSILQMLLRRANLDEARGKKDPFAVSASTVDTAELVKSGSQETPAISAEDTAISPLPAEKSSPKDDDINVSAERPKKKVTFDEDAAAPEPPAELFISENQPPSHAHDHDHSTTHFPARPSAPDLDPSDPDFLANLHSKYFPDLPADPAKLAWMAPIPTTNSPADLDSPYHPSQSSLPVSALRFDFKGRLVPPSVARQIPSSAGLHHHAEAPEAAGYTIPELARLARSAVPAQRCIAFQTLGRLLFRLGTGEWGVGEGGRDGEEDDLAFSIWRLVKAGYVIESLEEAAGVEEGVGHRGARAYAIEALWLFEKGGWKEKWRGL